MKEPLGKINRYLLEESLTLIRKSLVTLRAEHLKESIENLRVYKFDKLPGNKRSNSCAGLALFNRGEVYLHYTMFYPERFEELKKTLLHEVAHHIAHKLYDCRDHSSYWAVVMQSMHQPVEEFHKFGVLTPAQILRCPNCLRVYPLQRRLREDQLAHCKSCPHIILREFEP